MNLRLRKSLTQYPTAVAFLLPGLGLFCAFILGPMLYSLRISFFDWKILNPDLSVWIGLGNYARALEDPIFRRAVINTIAYSVVTVPIQITLGVAVALLLNQPIKGKGFFRVMYYLPVITSWVVVSLLFEYMFSGQAGLINYLLRDVLHVIDKNILWLADPILAFVPIDLLEIWKGVGWVAVIALAGLQVIPQHLKESAEVDGANAWQSFRYVTLPLLSPTLAFLFVMRTIGTLNGYISNLLITNGGDPLDQTHFVLTLMYEATFTRLDFGYGSALSYLLTIFIFVISIFQLRLLRRDVGFEAHA
jgi:multiple sugar transport system permease protein